ncbi:MAG: glucose-6-phosphate dehydrogenase, partial [Xanthobacteraceae bacterium]
LIGVDHNEETTEQWRQSLTKMMQVFMQASAIDVQAWSWLTSRMQYMPGDFLQPETFGQLAKLLAERRERTNTRNALFYLAVGDRFFGPVIEQLGQAGLTQQSEGAWRRVIVEKPFGHDLPSAEALNAQILKVLSEDQIYRIDHFLGKETVQNILVLRFANGIFEPLWNRDHIDHVQITAAETVGVEARGRFYERTGALRDMVPNHLFQLLAMIGMEPPISFNADAVRAKKTELLEAIHRVSPENAVRGQYGSGGVLGQKVPDYRHEPNVAPDSGTETYVALKLGIDNWRWAGVPFYLRTGKKLSARTTEIAVHFRQAPYALFRDTPVKRLPANILTLRIQPDEGLSISFSAKRPGSEIEIDGVAMDFAYREYFGPLAAVGYETLIYDCLIGDATLFQRDDTVEAAWGAVQGLLESWARDPATDFPNYAAGGAGPDAANRLLARDGRAWLPIRATHPHTAIRS